MDYALSDADISKALKGRTKILSYRDLKNYNSVNSLLEPFGNVVILYVNRENGCGHWCCLFRTPRGVEFFDSYGGKHDGKPDAEIGYIDKPLRKLNYSGRPYLSSLLAKYAKNNIVEYNDHELQGKGSSIATCGRHCICRIKTASMDIDTYARLLKTLGDTDKAVLSFTKPLIGK
jgi:hypothetical protein